LITRAYESARTAHRDQTRSSGESYINHPLAVARIVAELGLDETTIAAALLHDAVEDTELTIEQVQHEFGAEVGSIVDGVTKLDRLQFDSREAQQAATMRKMLVAMARDLRVLIIKLADRLHNMRTIAAMPAEKQRRIAQETMDIYAPLAHRLGMQELKQQLEDLSFAALFPKRYSELDNLVFTRTPERDVYLASMIAEIQSRLNSLRITCEVTGRGKHMWSIYEKMVQRGKEFDEIFDLVAVRIIVDSVKDCYGALGCIHGQWKPVVGRFKDYIAMPKFNLYQSLHTTVIGPQGKPLEVQIRTRDMHNRAEWGVAAHWSYKDGSSGEIDWLDRIVDWQSDLDDPTQFLEDLRTDLDQDELFVFTPKGRVISLPIGGSPVDFAYAVHTEVGHKCTGAKVNGRLVALDTILQSGDTCEIVTAKDDTIGPSEDWLRFVKSPRAKNKIKQWFSRERRDEMLERGMDTLNKEFRRLSLPLHTIWDSDALATEVEAAKFGDIDALLVSIGEGQSSARSVAQRIFKRISGGDDEEQISIARPTDGAPRRRRQSAGVHVDGIDDVLVRLSRCCTPVPGDEIVGFVTKGRGVSVHRADCANAIQLQADLSIRMIEVEWSRERNDTTFRAGVEVVALDRSRLLRDVANAISESHVNIVACSTHTGGDRVAKMRFEFELADPSYLAGILRTIKSIDGVYDAYRIVPGR
jgi:GTP pyrophosphokinase